MSSLRFVKAHACGNDFLVIEESAAAAHHAALAKRLCERNTGVEGSRTPEQGAPPPGYGPVARP